MLFEDDRVIISGIFTVDMYEGPAEPGVVRKFRYCLPSYELIFCISGESRLRFGEDQFINATNRIVYLPKGCTGGEYTAEMLQPTRCIDIYFDTPSPMPDRALVFSDCGQMKHFFTNAFQIWQSKRPGYFYETMQQLYRLIQEFRFMEEAGQSGDTLRRRAVDEYISKNYRCCNFDYRELCTVSGLKYSSFSNFFKRVYHMSPVQYVTRLKIELAKELLLTERSSVTQIAEECGFENVYYFSRVFKKLTGSSPSDFHFRDENAGKKDN